MSYDDLYNKLHDEVYIEVCELVSPNSIEFEKLFNDTLEDRIAKEWSKALSEMMSLDFLKDLKCQ